MHKHRTGQHRIQPVCFSIYYICVIYAGYHGQCQPPPAHHHQQPEGPVQRLSQSTWSFIHCAICSSLYYFHVIYSSLYLISFYFYFIIYIYYTQLRVHLFFALHFIFFLRHTSLSMHSFASLIFPEAKEVCFIYLLLLFVIPLFVVFSGLH